MNRILSIVRVLSDRNRLRILMALMEHEELCACQITELLQVTGATASRHLMLMVNAGLLESRKDGRWVYYRIAGPDANRPLLQWLRRELAGTTELSADRKFLSEILTYEPEEICRKQRGEICCPSK